MDPFFVHIAVTCIQRNSLCVCTLCQSEQLVLESKPDWCKHATFCEILYGDTSDRNKQSLTKANEYCLC